MHVNCFLKASGKAGDHKIQLPPIAYPSRRADAIREVLIGAACCEGAGGLLYDYEGDGCSSGGLRQAVHDSDVVEVGGYWMDPTWRSSSMARLG